MRCFLPLPASTPPCPSSHCGPVCLPHVVSRCAYFALHPIPVAHETPPLPRRHGEAVALINLGMALRGLREVAAAIAHLRSGGVVSQELGYSHPLARAHALHAQLALETLGRSHPARGAHAALEQLRYAARISEANGLRRAACDDKYNVLLAEMRWGQCPLSQCISKLEIVAEDAKEHGDKAAQMRAFAAIGLARLGRRGGSVGSDYMTISGVGFDSSPDPCVALPFLEEAMRLAVAVGDMRVRSEVAALLCLCHLLHPCASVAVAEQAVVYARDAKVFGKKDRGGDQAPHELTQLGVALIAANRRARGCVSALGEARMLLVAAVALARQQHLEGAEIKVGH